MLIFLEFGEEEGHTKTTTVCSVYLLLGLKKMWISVTQKRGTLCWYDGGPC